MPRRSITVVLAFLSALGAQAADGFYVGASGASYSIETGLREVPDPGGGARYTYDVCGGTATYSMKGPYLSGAELSPDGGPTGAARFGWRRGRFALEVELASTITVETTDDAFLTGLTPLTQAICTTTPTVTIAPRIARTVTYTLDQTALAALYDLVESGRVHLEARLEAVVWGSQVDDRSVHTVVESVAGVPVSTNVVSDTTVRLEDDGVGLGVGLDFRYGITDRFGLNAGLRQRSYGDASSTSWTLGLSYTF